MNEEEKKGFWNKLKSCRNCHWHLNDDGTCENCSRLHHISPDNWTPKESNQE